MDRDNLATYLNDHRAGAAAAVTVFGQLRSSPSGRGLEGVLTDLEAALQEDARALESFMERLGIPPSRPRRAAARVSGWVMQLKLIVDDPQGGPLRLLESLEMLATGVEGRLALWRALAAAAERAPELRQADFGHLAGRAEEQRARIEAVRLDAARAALAGKP